MDVTGARAVWDGARALSGCTSESVEGPSAASRPGLIGRASARARSRRPRIRAAIPFQEWRRTDAGPSVHARSRRPVARVRLARWPERDREHRLLVRRSLTGRIPAAAPTT